MNDFVDLDLPPEGSRTDEQRKDISLAWGLIGDSKHLLDSTEGHLAVLRAIQLGRKLEANADKGATGWDVYDPRKGLKLQQGIE